jgi:protoporphyrin/coproporphyrin ferrochelatase
LALARYLAEPEFDHGGARRTAVLLVNLGTPDAPTPAAVRRYLAEFLWDPRVVEIPRPLWWLILHGAILTTRPKASAAKYRMVWTDEGSPLKVHAERQAKLLGAKLAARGRHDLLVRSAMRYGNPSISQVIAETRAAGCDRLLLLPQYPQYAASTTASTLDETFRALSALRSVPELRTVLRFHDHPGYVAALARRVEQEWSQHGRPDVLLMSFHGVPRYTLELGDPYHCECLKTGRLLGEALGLAPDAYRVTLQSRFGRAEWLQPYTAATLQELARAGTRRVDVVCPGFVADCLETLEEIALEGKAAFLGAGGGLFRFIPCLNEDDAWIEALANIAETGMAGWDAPASAEARAQAASLARAKGALR